MDLWIDISLNKTHTELNLFYWNSSLNPPKSRKVPSTSDVNFVANQIDILGSINSADIIFLSEINDTSFKDIIEKVTNTTFSFELLNFKTKTNSVFDIAIIYNPFKIDLLYTGPVTREMSGTEIKVAIKVEILDKVKNKKIIFYTSHWPSFRTPDSEIIKTHAAIALKDDAKPHIDLGENIICMGDYNTEPYSEIFTINLMSTNDRLNVIKKPKDWLYNPFWKLLYSRLNSEQSNGSHDLGSCYSSSNKRPNWATFDQMFFSASFLKQKGWSIIEEETGRFFDDSILKNIKSTKSSMNHHPIKTLIRYI